MISHPTTKVAMGANWWGLAGEKLHGLFGRLSTSEVISGIPGFVILSLAEIAGYLLAAASFLALAATLKSGVHIRVTIVLAALGERRRQFLELWALGAATVLGAYMTFNIARFAFFSWRFHEVSPGLIPVPLVIPQAAMAAGVLVLTIALLDELVIVARGGTPTFRATEDALTLGKEG